MQIDKKWLSRAAAQEGFVRDTLEKVYRLTRVLQNQRRAIPWTV